MSAGYMDVKIMGREYRIACTPDDQAQLLNVVELVDQKMTDIASKTRNAIPERIAVMAAMSIGIDLLSKSAASGAPQNSPAPSAFDGIAASRIDALVQKVENALQDPEQPITTES